MSKAYKESGVDIERGDKFVSSIKDKVSNKYNHRVYSGVGGFSCLYEISEDKLISSGTDGVGTKLLLAQELKKHNTIGIDLVAMCVNDIICSGSRPLFFMDYLACGQLDLEVSDQIISGIIEGCDLCEIPLIGGETAEMPDLYKKDDYDLAGFAVGEVFKKDLIDGKDISEGDVIIGLPSSGLHSNGYSLARKLLKSTREKELMLKPTVIYSKVIQACLDRFGRNIHGLAHITGGGILNIARLGNKFDYILDSWPTIDLLPEVYSLLNEKDLEVEDLFQTFNMGVGMSMIVCADKIEELTVYLKEIGQEFHFLGHVHKGRGNVHLKWNKKNFVFKSQP